MRNETIALAIQAAMECTPIRNQARSSKEKKMAEAVGKRPLIFQDGLAAGQDPGKADPAGRKIKKSAQDRVAPIEATPTLAS